MKLRALVLSVLALLAAPAYATPHLTPVGLPCGGACEPTVFSILDALYGAGNYLRTDDGDDQLWDNLGSAGATAKAKFAGLNQAFGYVDGGDVFHPLFSVTASGFVAPSPFVTFTPFASGDPFRWASRATSSPTTFWTSFEADNVDPGTCLGDVCADHMITFLITGGPSAGNYVVAFEDLPAPGDRDYNDMVVEVSGTRPSVPEPGSLALVALGLTGLAARARRRR